MGSRPPYKWAANRKVATIRLSADGQRRVGSSRPTKSTREKTVTQHRGSIETRGRCYVGCRGIRRLRAVWVGWVRRAQAGHGFGLFRAAATDETQVEPADVSPRPIIHCTEAAKKGDPQSTKKRGVVGGLLLCS